MKQEKPEICALVPYFRNQIGERVVFTEDEDNPYYKQASPGITDYFPSVQDKQTKNFPIEARIFQMRASKENFIQTEELYGSVENGKYGET